MRLCLIRIYPVALDSVGVDTRTDIQFVAYDHKRDVWVIRRALERLLPLVEAFVRVTPRDVIDQNAAVGSTVEGDAQRLEALLPGCVPQLERHLGLTVGQSSPFLHKVCADGRLLALAYLLVAVAVEEGCLADTWLAD